MDLGRTNRVTTLTRDALRATCKPHRGSAQLMDDVIIKTYYFGCQSILSLNP